MRRAKAPRRSRSYCAAPRYHVAGSVSVTRWMLRQARAAGPQQDRGTTAQRSRSRSVLSPSSTNRMPCPCGVSVSPKRSPRHSASLAQRKGRYSRSSQSVTASRKRCHSVRLTARCWATRSAPIASTSAVSASSSFERLAQVRRACRPSPRSRRAPLPPSGAPGFDLCSTPRQGRLQHGGQRDVDGRRAVAQPVLEPRAGAALRRDAHRRTAVVVAPVAPVPRQLGGLEPLVRVDRRRAQPRERAVVLQHPADRVGGELAQPVVGRRRR